MNANALIEYLETHDYCEGDVKDAIELLRQQQAEIEALKLQLHTTLTNRALRTYDGKLE